MRLNAGEQHRSNTRGRSRMPVTLEELLLEQDMVFPWQLQDARNYQEQKGGTLSQALVRLRFVKDEEMTVLLSRRYGVPSIDLDPLTLDPAIIKALPEEMARKYKVLPLSRSGATLTVAMADPTNLLAMDDIRLTTGCGVEPLVASESALENAIDFCYGARSAGSRRDTALAEACAKVERTAWQYVSAMHAAAVGSARRPIRGIVEDVVDMRVRLTRERDEARARVGELERQLAEARSAAALAYAARVRPEERRSAAAVPPRPARPPSAPPG
jgi:hypothetical protein